MTIGERLEEARKRRGISIREAAEATKIRGDFLMAMESNSMDDINLPEIYRRGFLKNYSQFLKIDADKILTDYDALRLGSSKFDKRLHVTQAGRRDPHAHRETPRENAGEGERESFGRMELRESEEEEREARTEEPRQRERPTRRPIETDTETSNRGLYIKIGALFAAGFVLILLVFLLISLLTGEPAAEINPEGRTPAATATADEAPVYEEEEFTLVAEDNVTVIVNSALTKGELWRGTLLAGDRISLVKEGPVVLRYTDGSALTVEVGERLLPMPSAGVGRVQIP